MNFSYKCCCNKCNFEFLSNLTYKCDFHKIKIILMFVLIVLITYFCPDLSTPTFSKKIMLFSLHSLNYFLHSNTHRCLLLITGSHITTEARNVNFPCTTVADCGDPSHCRCDESLKLCICQYPPKFIPKVITEEKIIP